MTNASSATAYHLNSDGVADEPLGLARDLGAGREDERHRGAP